MSKAIYPGSFDPITYGHIDIMKRAKKIFDELIVAVVTNPNKQMLFSLEERKDLAEKALQAEGIKGVKVIAWDGLAVECAKQQGAHAIIRGLRASSDFEREFQMALTNRKLNDSYETIFLMTHENYSFISSSLVKELIEFGGDISAFVPPLVEQRLKEKFYVQREP